MRLFTAFTTAVLFVSPILARQRSIRHVGKREEDFAFLAREAVGSSNILPRSTPGEGPGSKATIIEQTPKNAKFIVNGSALPFVDFDVGESYAGLLPISNDAHADPSQLYFWFFPTQNNAANDEIVIWLNGGPGCSSLEGLLQENGPFVWQYGTYRPVRNPWSWYHLTNVVWIEQPAGTGFSEVRSTPKATNQIEVAEQFLGFWKNFVDTFGLHGRKVYITGESYAGYYVPYIADAMHNKSDKAYYNIDSIMIYDPSTTYGVVQEQAPVVPFVDYWGPLFALNNSFMADIRKRADTCGYTAFMETAMTFPPKGPLPPPPAATKECRLWSEVYLAAILKNPCFDIYQVATTCPLLWDVLGFPGSIPYQGGPFIYFNLDDVKKAINAPVHTQWTECANGVLRNDTSPPSGLSVLPRVIEKNQRTIIGHGMLDMILIMNGTIAMIQNMTWNGAQGFSKGPSEWRDFYVPYHSPGNKATLAGAGVFGKWHTERGFTFCTVDLSGHMIPQYQPSASYRQLEYLLGRIPDLGE